MSLIRINRRPSRRQLAQFGLLWLLCFSLLGWVALSRTQSPKLAGAIWILAAGAPGLGWVFPSWMRRLYVGLSYAAFPIGLVVSHVALAAVYYGVLTPTGLVLKWFRRDPLGRRFDRAAETYWVRRDAQRDPRRYFRQF